MRDTTLAGRLADHLDAANASHEALLRMALFALGRMDGLTAKEVLADLAEFAQELAAQEGPHPIASVAYHYLYEKKEVTLADQLRAST